MAFKNYSKNQEEEISPYLTYKQAKKIREKRKHQELLKAVADAGRPNAVKEAERILLTNPTTRNSYVFTCPKTGEQQEFHGIEYSEYNAAPNQPLIHGIICISEYAKDGSKIGEKQDDIYMYQPRFEGSGGFIVGPRVRNGTISRIVPYAYKDPKTGQIYIGNIPKREVTSGLTFDFDGVNKENHRLTALAVGIKNRKLEDIVSIKYNRDQEGNLKIVDLNNPQEKAKFDAYISKYHNGSLGYNMVQSHLYRIKKAVSVFEELDDKIEEAIYKMNINDKINAKINAEQAKKAQNVKTKPTTAEENAKIINDYLKYGIAPTYSSPLYNKKH